MTVLIGTQAGIYRADSDDVENAERVLDAERVDGIVRGEDAWFAATANGVYRSTDTTDWTDCSLPQTPARSVRLGPRGRVYAGTRPAALYVSADGGDTWTDCDGFQSIPSRGRWWNPDVTPHTRAIAVDHGSDASASDRLVVGIDGGGVHVSTDGGETWEERRGGVAHFVHDLRVLGQGEYVAATDAGLFRTRDAGRWWDYLYGDEMAHRYFRGVFGSGPVVYAGGARSHPPVWDGHRGADAALYRLDLSDRDPEVTRVRYPGEPEEVVLCGTDSDESVLAGTNRGRLLERVPDGNGDRDEDTDEDEKDRDRDGDGKGVANWETVGVVPSESQIRCLWRG